MNITKIDKEIYTLLKDGLTVSQVKTMINESFVCEAYIQQFVDLIKRQEKAGR